MAKFKQPSSSRVQFDDLQQTKMNIATKVDSTAINLVGYNPDTKTLKIRFDSRPYVEYTYYKVPIKKAQDLVDAIKPRRKMLPKRNDSLGSTFYTEIRNQRYRYDRFNDPDPKFSSQKKGKERR